MADMRRIILLGASNLTIAFPRVLTAVENAFDGPLEISAALGHGRSFGMWSHLLHRALPGIVGCGLWRAVESRQAQPIETLGLITDVGNDLLYGADVPQIAEWIETCLARMKNYGADVVLTLLPMGSIEQLPPWRYYAARTLFFPRSRLSFAEICRRVDDLQHRLKELGRQYDVHTIEQPGGWYGPDPIHIRHSRRSQAWNHILSGWPSFPTIIPTGQAPLAKRLQLFRIQPETRRVWGRAQKTTQPAYQVSRTSVSLF
jgi:hypothetical protein